MARSEDRADTGDRAAKQQRTPAAGRRRDHPGRPCLRQPAHRSGLCTSRARLASKGEGAATAGVPDVHGAYGRTYYMSCTLPPSLQTVNPSELSIGIIY
jgi:hypothetical protein